MKQIISTYSFDKTAKTVTFTDFTTISLDRILLITNVTANTIIYQFNNSALGGTAAGNVLTLAYDTGSMNNTDKLQILYDAALGDPQYDAGAPLQGRHQATPPTIADGKYGVPQLDSSGNLKANLAVALSKDIDSIFTYPRGSDYRNITSSTLINTGACKLSGIWVSAASSTPTIKVWDSTSGSGSSLVGTFTPAAGTMYSFPFARAANGLYVSLSGTVDCTVFYDTTAI